MTPRLYEISLASFAWKDSQNIRPWVIVEVFANGHLGCFPISSHCYHGQCYQISAEHPDFKATGLTKTCHVHYDSIFMLQPSNLVRHKGVIQRQMLSEFLDVAGL